MPTSSHRGTSPTVPTHVARAARAVVDAAAETGAAASERAVAVAGAVAAASPVSDEMVEALKHEFWSRYAPGRVVDLGERGQTFVRELAGPTADAPVVVLIHGWTATAALNWATVMPHLARQYHVVAIDQRGHGRGGRGEFTLEDCARDVVGVLDALEVDEAVLVGYSMGGPIAQLTYHLFPERVSGLVFASTSNRLKPRLATLLPVALAANAVVRLPALATDWRWIPEISRIPPARWMDEVRHSSPRSLMRVAGELWRFDSAAWLRDVDVPCSVVETTLDELVPRRTQEAMARLLPDCRTYRVHAGHFNAPMGAGHWPAQVVRAVDSVQRRIAQRHAWAARVQARAGAASLPRVGRRTSAPRETRGLA